MAWTAKTNEHGAPNLRDIAADQRVIYWWEGIHQMHQRRFNNSLTAIAYLSEMEKLGLAGDYRFRPRGDADQLPFVVSFKIDRFDGIQPADGAARDQDEA
ncbi:MAG: hypothetical protein ACT6T2_18175 [Shinella sp.]